MQRDNAQLLWGLAFGQSLGQFSGQLVAYGNLRTEALLDHLTDHVLFYADVMQKPWEYEICFFKE